MESDAFPAKRDEKSAFHEVKKMMDVLMTPESALSMEQRQWVAGHVADNFKNHVNKGFLKYRKSVTETSDAAVVTDWYGEGSILRDVLGREYIDMLGGFGLYSPGIRHPKIVAAVKAQLDRNPQYSQEMLDPLRAHLAKVIAMLTPGDIQYGFFANSGTEAVDGAMKLAKLHTGKKGFIATMGAFHGKSLGALSLLGKAVYREPVLPLLEGIRHVPFGDAEAVENELALAHSVGDGIAAVVAEPVQGEAGAIVPPEDYWPKLREICTQYEVLLIADEVQTGFGRTGAIFGVDHWGVTPDIMCFGKALGGGVVPMSGFFSNAEIWACLEPNPFMHTTTTGGNPLACAAALAQVEVLLEEDLAGQAAEKGAYILERLHRLERKFPNILKEVRGKGLLIGMEFFSDEIGYKVATGLFSRRVLTSGTLTNARTFRIEPALNIPYDLIDKTLERLEDTLTCI